MAKSPRKSAGPSATGSRSAHNERSTRTSLKGRIVGAIEAAVRTLAQAGTPPTEIARAVTTQFRLSPPLSHTSVTRFLDRSPAAEPSTTGPAAVAALPVALPTVAADDLDAASFLRSQIVSLTEGAKHLAELGQGTAYLRSAGVLAGLTKQLLDVERKQGAGKKVADGLGAILLEAAREDAHRCASSPGQWLLDEVPRVVRQLRGVVDALQRIAPEDRDRHAKVLLSEIDRLR